MNMIGIYFPEHSFWHGLDPRSKVLIVIAIITTLMASQGIYFGMACLLSILLYRSSKLPWRLEYEIFFKFKWLLLIPFIVNLLVPFVQNNWYITIKSNFPGALLIGLRLTAILLVATWLSYVTKPMILVEGISRFFKPFERFGKGGLDIPLMMGLVVRFIPELLYESENIMVAQRIRGIKPGFRLKNSSSWIKSTIIPIFLGSIRKAAALAIAMEARGYRPGVRRTPVEEIKLRFPDYIIIGLSIVLIIWQLVEVW